MSIAQQFESGGIISYGAFSDVSDDVSKKTIFVPQRRSRVNALGICANIFLPWLLFSVLYWVMIFNVHYTHPDLAWLAVLGGFGVAAVFALIASNRVEYNMAPSWHTYAAGACCMATILAAFFGNLVFSTHMRVFYDYGNLNTYVAVNPAIETGAQVADSGRVYFSDNTHLDLARTAGFKHHDMYCVVPITAGNDLKLRTYDFWAVGINCCNDGRFMCMDGGGGKIRSGLRHMDDESRQFFRLAVQQAEAAYGITASHPVFYHWTQDPLEDIRRERVESVKWYIAGCGAYFMTNLFCVMSMVFAFAKIVYHGPNV